MEDARFLTKLSLLMDLTIAAGGVLDVGRMKDEG